MRFYFVFISSFILLLPITSHVLASKPHNLTFNQLHWCFRTSRGLAGWTWWPRCPTSPSPSPPPSHSTSTSLSTAPSTRSALSYLMVVVVTILNCTVVTIQIQRMPSHCNLSNPRHLLHWLKGRQGYGFSCECLKMSKKSMYRPSSASGKASGGLRVRERGATWSTWSVAVSYPILMEVYFHRRHIIQEPDLELEEGCYSSSQLRSGAQQRASALTVIWIFHQQLAAALENMMFTTVAGSQ